MAKFMVTASRHIVIVIVTIALGLITNLLYENLDISHMFPHVHISVYVDDGF